MLFHNVAARSQIESWINHKLFAFFIESLVFVISSFVWNVFKKKKFTRKYGFVRVKIRFVRDPIDYSRWINEAILTAIESSVCQGTDCRWHTLPLLPPPLPQIRSCFILFIHQRGRDSPRYWCERDVCIYSRSSEWLRPTILLFVNSSLGEMRKYRCAKRATECGRWRMDWRKIATDSLIAYTMSLCWAYAKRILLFAYDSIATSDCYRLRIRYNKYVQCSCSSNCARPWAERVWRARFHEFRMSRLCV